MATAAAKPVKADPVAIDAALLAGAMKNAAALVRASETIPMLANVRLWADGDVLEITTTNLDIEFRQTLPLRSGARIDTMVSAHRLAAIAAAVEPGAQLALSFDGGRVSVSSGRSRWALPALGSQDFPVLPVGELGEGVTIPGAALANAMARAAWATCSETTRIYLAGLYFNNEAGKFRVTGCDGNIIVVVDMSVPWPTDAAEVIVPNEYVKTLLRLAGDAAEVRLAWDEKKIRAELGGVTLTGKLIDEKYPDYRRVIGAPETGGAEVIADPAALRRALRRVELIATERTRAVKVVLSEDKIALSVVSPQHGTASEEVACNCSTPHETGFNVRYLSQMLEAIGGDTVIIRQQDERGPALFRRVVSDGAAGIVMPMRI